MKFVTLTNIDGFLVIVNLALVLHAIELKNHKDIKTRLYFVNGDYMDVKESISDINFSS